MGLVDYSSGSDSASASASDSAPAGNAAKRRKTSTTTLNKNTKKPPPPPPPLPAAFHDLYASTVRVSTVDDPALHQGRRRVNPHRVGSWPSHLYLDIRPSDAQRALLEHLVARIAAALVQSSSTTGPSSPGTGEHHHHAAAVPIHSFLSSDLGAPQPLHISLSRPLSLQTATKDGFLARAREAVAVAGVAPFRLRVRGVYWHRTRESARSFLVLKVASRAAAVAPTTTTTTTTEAHGSGEKETGNGNRDMARAATTTTTNPELQALLAKFNSLAAEYGQPTLYTATRPPPQPQAAAFNGLVGTLSSPQAAETPSVSGGITTATATTTTPPPSQSLQPLSTTTRDAFHVSIAWSPAEPTPRLRSVTAEVARAFFASSSPPSAPRSPAEDTATTNKTAINTTGSDKASSSGSSSSSSSNIGSLTAMTLHVDAVKLKIGNVVTSIPLPASAGC